MQIGNLNTNTTFNGSINDGATKVLAVAVVPQLADEFRCDRCFLVQHRTRRAKPGVDICLDCA